MVALRVEHIVPRSPESAVKLVFVTCVSDWQILRTRLLTSPCLQAGGYPVLAYHNASSAATAFNSARVGTGKGHWLVWVHQDVYLPEGWDTTFIKSISTATDRYPQLAVVGVYGVRGAAGEAVRVGHVLDRGMLLQEPEPMPCLVDSLDELLFAVSTDVELDLDADLRFDFYATDLVLRAKAKGMDSVVVDAYCEHWSETPRALLESTMVERIETSAAVFESKWAHRLPITTPSIDIREMGDTHRFLQRFNNERA